MPDEVSVTRSSSQDTLRLIGCDSTAWSYRETGLASSGELVSQLAVILMGSGGSARPRRRISARLKVSSRNSVSTSSCADIVVAQRRDGQRPLAHGRSQAA